MTKKRHTMIIGGIVILAQIVAFRDYLPFLSSKIIVKGISCTCPDAEVKNGEYHLRSMTPDSLMKYNLDYSEIYFENDISTPSDPMGVNEYLITGKVVGKGSISEGDGHYYPLFKIDKYYDAFFYHIIEWLAFGLLLLELFLLYNIIKRQKTLHKNK